MFDIRLYKQIIDLWVNYKRVVLNQKPNRGPQSDLKLFKNTNKSKTTQI